LGYFNTCGTKVGQKRNFPQFVDFVHVFLNKLFLFFKRYFHGENTISNRKKCKYSSPLKFAIKIYFCGQKMVFISFIMFILFIKLKLFKGTSCFQLVLVDFDFFCHLKMHNS